MADNESLSSIIEKLKKRRESAGGSPAPAAGTAGKPEEEIVAAAGQAAEEVEKTAEAADEALTAKAEEAAGVAEDLAKDAVAASKEELAEAEPPIPDEIPVNDSPEEVAAGDTEDFLRENLAGAGGMADDDLFASLVSDLREDIVKNGGEDNSPASDAPDLSAFYADTTAEDAADSREDLISSLMSEIEAGGEDGATASDDVGQDSDGVSSDAPEADGGEAGDSGKSGQLSDDMLLAAFGYSGAGVSDGEKGGYEPPAPSRIESIRGKQQAANTEVNLDCAFAYEGHEYKNRSQNGRILNAYDREKRKMYIRLGGTAVFFLLALIFDLGSKKFGGALNAATYPVVSIMISLQILLICAAFSAKKLYYGLVGIIRVRPIPASLSASVVLLTVLYDILIAIAAPRSGFTLYNSPAAFCLLSMALADFAELFRQAGNFRSISSWESVTTLEPAAEEGRQAESGAYRLLRGDFAENYFSRTNRTDRKYRILNYVIAPVTALALIMMIITLAKKDTGFVAAMNVFIVTVQFSIPTFAVIADAIPFLTFCYRRLNGSTVILHETDTADFEPVRSIVLDETDMFGDGSLKISRVRMCSPQADIYSVMTDTSAICSEIGGTISTAFNRISEESDTETVRDIVINRIVDGGIDAYAGGRHYIIGSMRFLSENSIVCNGCDDGRYLVVTPRGAVLHIAVDGTEAVRLYMEYTPGRSFTDLLDSFRGRQIKVELHCVDPNINDEFVRSVIGGSDIAVEVVRKSGSVLEDEKTKGRVKGGLLSKGEEWMSLIETAGMCRNYRNASKLNFYIIAGFTALGLLLSVFLGMFGASVGMSALYILLFRLLAVIPSVLIARMYIY